jgi:hypothetical protein
MFEIMGLAILSLIVWQLWEIRTAPEVDEKGNFKKDED